MKIGNYKIKHHYTIIRLMLDLVSAGLLYLIVQTLFSLIIAVNEVNVKFLNSSANAQGVTLSWYSGLIFPVIAVSLVVVSLIFTFKNRRIPKRYFLNENTAQKYYDIIIISTGLIRIIALLGIFDIFYIQSMLILKLGGGFLSVQVICDIILIIIIIRFTMYRISALSKKEADEIKKDRHIVEN